MANEIQVSAKLKVANGASVFEYSTGSMLVNQSVQGGPTPGYLTIGITEESETFSELSVLGWLIMRNLDPTNFVEWGFSTGVYGGRMEPGESAGPFRLKPGTTLYLKADTAPCRVLVYALED